MNLLVIGGVILIIVGTIMGLAATYQSDKKAECIQIELTQVKDYSIPAMMLIYGTDRMVDAGPGVTITQHSDLFDRMSRVLLRKGDTAYVKNDLALLTELEEVTTSQKTNFKPVLQSKY